MQPYTNMFASDEGSVNPKYPVNTQIGRDLPQGTSAATVLGAYGYGISPSSVGPPSRLVTPSPTQAARRSS